MALMQKVLEDFFDGDHTGMGTLDGLYAMSFAFTRSSRAKLRKLPDDKNAKLLASIGFEDWCELIDENVLPDVVDAMNALNKGEDPGNESSEK